MLDYNGYRTFKIGYGDSTDPYVCKCMTYAQYEFLKELQQDLAEIDEVLMIELYEEEKEK